MVFRVSCEASSRGTRAASSSGPEVWSTLLSRRATCTSSSSIGPQSVPGLCGAHGLKPMFSPAAALPAEQRQQVSSGIDETDRPFLEKGHVLQCSFGKSRIINGDQVAAGRCPALLLWALVVASGDRAAPLRAWSSAERGSASQPRLFPARWRAVMVSGEFDEHLRGLSPPAQASSRVWRGRPVSTTTENRSDQSNADINICRRKRRGQRPSSAVCIRTADVG